MNQRNQATEAERTCDCKVGRVAARHGLDGIDADLADRWTGATGQRESLRELARYFNEQVLRAVLEAAGVDLLDGEVENTYRLLRDEEVSSGMRTQARSRLRRYDVDVDRLEADFVSHQTIHTHLTECLGVERPSAAESAAERIETERETIRSLQNRARVVAEDSIRRLRDTGRLAVGEIDVFVEVSVLCEECGTIHDVGEVLDRGGCDCQGAD